MSIETNINIILEGDSNITDKVGSYNSGTEYMIFNSNGLPTSVKDDTTTRELTSEDTTINYYSALPISGAEAYIDTEYTVVCRASTELAARQLQQACFDAFFRVRSTDKKNHFVGTYDTVIPPQNADDNWNASVTVRARGSIKCL